MAVSELEVGKTYTILAADCQQNNKFLDDNRTTISVVDTDGKIVFTEGVNYLVSYDFL